MRRTVSFSPEDPRRHRRELHVETDTTLRILRATLAEHAMHRQMVRSERDRERGLVDEREDRSGN